MNMQSGNSDSFISQPPRRADQESRATAGGAREGATDRPPSSSASATAATATEPGSPRRPPWLKVRMPGGEGYMKVRHLLASHHLHTVCKSANCPNAGECWEQGTATFMINGDLCSRSCTFCNVAAGRPSGPPDPGEPERVADAAATLALEHVVVTSVTRDDLPDGGAGQFAAVIRALRRRLPGSTIEVLIPDFRGDAAALDLVLRERPDVLNHNVETVPRLYREVRPQADFAQSLAVLRRAAEAGLVAKSGFMLGLGETVEEIEALLRDLRAAGVRLVTIGQYLRPTPRHHAIVRYAPPEEFERWRRLGLELGFAGVDSAPLVRSSYHAKRSFERAASAEEKSRE